MIEDVAGFERTSLFEIWLMSMSFSSSVAAIALGVLSIVAKKPCMWLSSLSH